MKRRQGGRCSKKIADGNQVRENDTEEDLEQNGVMTFGSNTIAHMPSGKQWMELTADRAAWRQIG